jgi:hypothetical protein
MVKRPPRDQATAYCSIGFQPVVGPREDVFENGARLSRETRCPAGDRLEAYATIRRRLVAEGAWRHRQDAFERSLDMPESPWGTLIGKTCPARLSWALLRSGDINSFALA